MTSPHQPDNLLDSGGGPHRRLPMYMFLRPRCPACGSAKLKTRKSVAQGDGSVLRHYACHDCREPFRALIE